MWTPILFLLSSLLLASELAEGVSVSEQVEPLMVLGPSLATHFPSTIDTCPKDNQHCSPLLSLAFASCSQLKTVEVAD